MILTAKKGTAFEQVLRELYERKLRNKEEATEVLTEYYGVKPVEIRTIWCLGALCIVPTLDFYTDYVPRPLKKGVKEYIGGLTIDHQTKEGKEFLNYWHTLECSKGLSGESLEKFGIHTLDPDTRRWQVDKTDYGLYCLIINEYAVQLLTNDAKEMMTIEQ